jgi:anti-sigma B factor antagonist
MTDLARVETSTVHGTAIIHVRGEIDLSNADQVRDAIGAAVPDDAVVVVVDLSDTAYLDSAGVAMIFRLAERLNVGRQELRLVVPPDAPIRAVVRLTSLDQVVPVRDTIG